MIPLTLAPSSELFTLQYVSSTEDSIILHLRTHRERLPCPDCGVGSSRIHSRYFRRVASRPWNGVPVRWRLLTRKFYCDRKDCSRGIFTEPLPEVVPRHSQRSTELARDLRGVGMALGGEAGSRLATALGMGVSPDTLLRLVRAGVPGGRPTPRILGVDDWAWRKGHRYGTILVDLERGEVVDLLPDRKAETLAHWLREHPGVEIISRDRGTAFAEGATAGAPDAQQVADRWHLGKNLLDSLEAFLLREHSTVRQAAQPESEPVETTETPEPDPFPAEPEPLPATETLIPRYGNTGRQREQSEQRRSRRLARYDDVQRLHAAGHTTRAIGKQLGISRGTVRKFLASDGFPERQKKVACPGPVAAYADYLRRRWDEGCHNAQQLWEEIRQQGYIGGRTNVYRFVSSWRLRPGAGSSIPGASVPPPSAKTTVCWLLGSQDKRTEAEAAFLRRLQEMQPDIATAQELALRFFRLARKRDPRGLEQWVSDALQSPIVELQRFCAGLQRDWSAVLAGFTLKWSNGPVEGQVNRLKMIKRQMYGRAGFSLLRARVVASTPTG